ncbi:MAG TPA: beta-galactosidase, partial [Candidatus Merdenecus merdavium]|nr:beta-galactosidase [Candidatus Merdenecus merdavium]
MRTCININNGWLFSKEDLPEYASHDFPRTNADTINIPHTWNQFDGQDGGNNYFRGGCWYQKRLSLPDIGNDKELYIEFGAVNSVADVYINGKKLSSHAGGYSGFRVNISEFAGMKDVLLCVRADNSDNPDVYPRTADYTFYGGIYRDVTLCMVHKTHFAMNEYGSSGIFVHAESANSCAEIRIESHVENPKAGLLVEYTILTQDGETIAKLQTEWCKSSVMLQVQNPHLWNGRKDPYLYRLHATLIDPQN